ncbi:unnamed protein product [Oncorhynchus mykiss]|uniref:Uncharacterized protein n=1 Tax=Oncorhynchus mykiss TaxID=8022 RepID=A0A060YDE1_ONCMY|nr:unnamed protein product [Oncorhynchus mykiss]
MPVLRSVQRWSDQSDSTGQDCFDHVDWDMFRIASDNNIDEYADSVSEFISKCIGDVVPTATIKTFPNPSGQEEYLCKNAVHRLQLSI